MNAMMKLVVDNGPARSVDDGRRRLIAKLHIASKALGILEEDYRALLMRLTGHESAKDCDDRQLVAVLAEFERMGWRTSGGRTRHAVGGSGVVRKARAMWISLYQLGAIDDPSDSALDAFGCRQLKVDRLAWADERQGFRLIEALKAIADRAGWEQRVPSRMPAPERIRLLKDRLVGAQLAKLATAGRRATGPIAADRGEWSNQHLERAAAELAARIRDIPCPT